MRSYDRLADLELDVDGHDLAVEEREVSAFTRATTVVSLHGAGETGRGEDVTYDPDEHYALVEAADFDLAGSYTLDSFSSALDDLELFPAGAPGTEAFRNYRRWGFESAALDLALRQADTDLASAVGRTYDPVRFVVSPKLGDPPTADAVREWLELDPGLEFKLDPTPDWTDGLVEDLAATGAVRILDLKGHYRGTEVDNPPDPDLYRRVVEAFPDAVLEDPALTPDTGAVLDGQEGRISWDAPIHGVADVEALPFEPSWLNVKPSRFGTVESLLDCVEHCLDRGVVLYGGGQFELDVGRRHLHAIAALFYPDGPNDVAPTGYNDPEPRAGLPQSPLKPPADPVGLDWG